MAEETPEHLRHIDRRANETQEIVRGLRGEEEAPPPPRRPRRSAPKGVSPLDAQILQLHERMEEPYARYTPAGKSNLKAQLASKKRREPRDAERIIAEENRKLDELERGFIARQRGAEEKRRRDLVAGRKQSLLDRIRFWFYRRSRADLFEDGVPARAVFEHFDETLKGKYKSVAAPLATITDRLVGNEFFSAVETNEPLSPLAYNLFVVLSKERLGVALAHVTSTATMSSDLRTKVHELDELARIFIILSTDPDYHALVNRSLKALADMARNASRLGEYSRKLLTLTPELLEALSGGIDPFFDSVARDEQTIPRLLACYSWLFGRPTTIAELSEYLGGISPVEDRRKLLTAQARTNAARIVAHLEQEIATARARHERLQELHTLITTAEHWLAARTAEMPPRDQTLYLDDPFMLFHKHINDLLYLFEDVVIGRSAIALTTGGAETPDFFASYREELTAIVADLPIKPEILGKVKRNYRDDPLVFRKLVFDRNTEVYKSFQKLIQRVQAVNGMHAVRFARLCQGIANRLFADKNSFLSQRIAHTEFSRILREAWSHAPHSTVGGRQVPVPLAPRDPAGRETVYEADSLYGYLLLGASLGYTIGAELCEYTLSADLAETEKAERALGDLERSISGFRDEGT